MSKEIKQKLESLHLQKSAILYNEEYIRMRNALERIEKERESALQDCDHEGAVITAYVSEFDGYDRNEHYIEITCPDCGEVFQRDKWGHVKERAVMSFPESPSVKRISR